MSELAKTGAMQVKHRAHVAGIIDLSDAQVQSISIPRSADIKVASEYLAPSFGVLVEQDIKMLCSLFVDASQARNRGI
jgi:hypothetical protein